MDKKIEIKEWIEYAKRDFNSAIFLKNMNPAPMEIICYHCEQSAEKFLKAFMILKDEQIMRTHDLVLLLHKCMIYEKEFNDIKQECVNLTKYGTITRYPYFYEISRDDMDKAIIDCEKIIDFIENKINNYYEKSKE